MPGLPKEMLDKIGNIEKSFIFNELKQQGQMFHAMGATPDVVPGLPKNKFAPSQVLYHSDDLQTLKLLGDITKNPIAKENTQLGKQIDKYTKSCYKELQELATSRRKNKFLETVIENFDEVSEVIGMDAKDKENVLEAFKEYKEKNDERIQKNKTIIDNSVRKYAVSLKEFETKAITDGTVVGDALGEPEPIDMSNPKITQLLDKQKKESLDNFQGSLYNEFPVIDIDVSFKPPEEEPLIDVNSEPDKFRVLSDGEIEAEKFLKETKANANGLLAIEYPDKGGQSGHDGFEMVEHSDAPREEIGLDELQEPRPSSRVTWGQSITNLLNSILAFPKKIIDAIRGLRTTAPTLNEPDPAEIEKAKENSEKKDGEEIKKSEESEPVKKKDEGLKKK